MIVFSWSGVGGDDSTTSRLNWRGGAAGLVDGYGEDRADLSRERALVEGGEVG
jgi:hypothetical protein